MPMSISNRAFSRALTINCCVAAMLSLSVPLQAAKRRAPAGGQRAVVVDERLAVLREGPQLRAPFVQRLGRGRMVALMGAARGRDGVNFYRVAVTQRTRGWLQADSVCVPARAAEDARLLRLIRGSDDFDQVARARIFLDLFPASALRPAVLLLFGETASGGR